MAAVGITSSFKKLKAKMPYDLFPRKPEGTPRPSLFLGVDATACHTQVCPCFWASLFANLVTFGRNQAAPTGCFLGLVSVPCEAA